jgi:prevent-host-death family protein
VALVKIPIRHLRADVAAAVRRAGAGERIVVTVAGRPVAQLGPLEDTTTGASLDDLVARGLLLAPRRTGDYHPGDVVPTWRGARLDRLLREIRG